MDTNTFIVESEILARKIIIKEYKNDISEFSKKLTVIRNMRKKEEKKKEREKDKKKVGEKDKISEVIPLCERVKGLSVCVTKKEKEKNEEEKAFPPPTKKVGIIYIFTSPDYTKDMKYKIGIVNDSSVKSVKSRLSTLTTGTPGGNFIKTWDCVNPQLSERYIHDYMNSIGLKFMKEWVYCGNIEKLISLIEYIIDMNNAAYQLSDKLVSETRSKYAKNSTF